MARLEPHGHLLKAVTIAEFDRLQAEQVKLVDAAARLQLDRVHLTSPFDSRVRYSLFSALWIIPRHEQRHIGQAERVWSHRG